MMAGRALPPIWLCDRSRFAGWGRRKAFVALTLLVLLLAACLTAIGSPGPRPSVPVAREGQAVETDLMLYQTIIDHVRHGESYYASAAEAQRAAGYPLKPFIAIRLPTLAIVLAALPPVLVRLLMWVLCMGVMIAWVVRLRPALTRIVPVAIAGIAVLAGLVVNLQPGLEAFHEVSSGPLIALSLALRRPDHWGAAVAFGLCAMLVRETAAIYVGVMWLFALLEGRRTETFGWTAILAVYAIVIALHAHAVAQVVQPLDPRSPGWTGLQGFGFYVKLVTISTALDQLPQWLASLVLGFALFGWTAWRDPIATRAVAIFAGYAAVIALFARSDNFYWALMTTPVLLVGLVFAVDGLRDLLAAAFDRRRLTVTRLVR